MKTKKEEQLKPKVEVKKTGKVGVSWAEKDKLEKDGLIVVNVYVKDGEKVFDLEEIK